MTRFPRRNVCVIVFCFNYALQASGTEPQIQAKDHTLSAEKLAQVTTVMSDFFDDNKIAGAVTMVSHHGKIVYCEAVGKQNIEDNLLMRRDTIFRIFSMTKPITSVAALILVERGDLALDDPLSKYDARFHDLRVYVDGFGDEMRTEPLERPITIRDLFRHTAGFTYGSFGITEVDRLYRLHRIGKRDATLDVNCGNLALLPLVHQPGTKFRYSVSTDVLGHVVEVVSGKHLDQFFADEIFEPLGMTDTSFSLPLDKLDRFAASYGPRLFGDDLRRIDNPAKSRYLEPPKMLSGGGGLLSTADDYMKFCNMLIAHGKYDGGQLLKPESIAEMTHNQVPGENLSISVAGVPIQGVGFGFGVSVRTKQVDYADYIPIGEYGWSGIASTHFWISPQHEMGAVILTQYMPFKQDLSDEIKKVVYHALDD